MVLLQLQFLQQQGDYSPVHRLRPSQVQPLQLVDFDPKGETRYHNTGTAFRIRHIQQGGHQWPTATLDASGQQQH